MPKRLRENCSLLPRVYHGDSPGWKLVSEHGLQQLRPGGCERIRRLVAQRLLQEPDLRQGYALLANKPAQTATITFVPQRAGQQCEMDAAPGFLPRAPRPTAG